MSVPETQRVEPKNLYRFASFSLVIAIAVAALGARMFYMQLIQGPQPDATSAGPVLLLGCQPIPSFVVEGTHRFIDAKRARQMEFLDQFDDVRFVLVPTVWAVRPAIEFKGNQLLQRDEPRIFPDLIRFRKRHFAAWF